MRYIYDTINLQQNTHNRHFVARPLGRAMKCLLWFNYSDVIMSTMAYQISSITIVYSTVYSRCRLKPSKLCVIGLCVGNSPLTGGFPVQKASNADNIFDLMTSSCQSRIYALTQSLWCWRQHRVLSDRVITGSDGIDLWVSHHPFHLYRETSSPMDSPHRACTPQRWRFLFCKVTQ